MCTNKFIFRLWVKGPISNNFELSKQNLTLSRVKVQSLSLKINKMLLNNFILHILYNVIVLVYMKVASDV